MNLLVILYFVDQKSFHMHYSVDFLEAYWEPCLTSMMKRFCENKQQFVAINDFGEKALS